MSLAGYLHSAFVVGISLFYVMLLLQSFFGSGMGFVYGIGNLGKFIGPAGLALIAGSSNYVKPEATLEALVPGFNYFAFWYVLGAFAFRFIGFETSRRSIDEIDGALGRAAAVAVASAPARSAGN